MSDLNKDVKNEKVDFEPTEEQKLAIAHKGSNLLLSAGAGSGKTATLTDRIVEKISSKDPDDQNSKPMDISRMLVVTYTKDAANELKTRIAEKLAKKLRADPKNPHLCEQFVKVTSADISTIHSFCFKCIKPYLNRFNLDKDIRIAEKKELELLQLEAMNEVLDEFYEADLIDPDFLLVVDCYTSYRDESYLATELIDLYVNKLSNCVNGIDILTKKPELSCDFFETSYGLVLLNHLKMIINHYKPLIDDIYSQAIGDCNNRKYVAHFGDLKTAYDSLFDTLDHPTYGGIKAILNSISISDMGRTRKGEFPTIDADFANYVREGAKSCLTKLATDYFYTDNDAIKSTIEQNYKICCAIHKVLKKYEITFQEKKKKHGVCDYADLEKLTLALLYKEDGSVSEIANEISAQYDEVYIDEYQDVNSIQDKIFTAIAKNKRFMVGDIKQSVYSFRYAEPELFSEYRDSYIPYGQECTDKNQGRTIFMSDNFRCDESVIKLSNHVSDYMFGKSHGFHYVPEGDKLKFSKKYNEFDENGNKIDYKFSNAKLCLIDESSIPKDSYLKDCNPQAEFVAQEIKRLIKSTLPNGKKIEYKHIAVLLKKYEGHVDKYIDAFKKYGIKYEFVQKENFFEKPHISLLLSILNAIDNPSKDTYFAGALLSHIFKFSLDDLIAVRRFSPPHINLYSAMQNYLKDCKDETDLKTNIADFFKKLDEFKNATKKQTAHDAISFVLNKTGYLSYCNKDERSDVIKLYGIARKYEKGTFKGLYSFLRYIDNFSEDGKLDDKVATDSENCVKIITMHHSKGLEYEVCFLCDLEKSYFNELNKPDILFNRNLGICGYVSRANGVVKYNSLIRECVDMATMNEDREEAMRLLYVAMTRARSMLYLTASVSNYDKAVTNAKYRAIPDEYTLYSQNCHINLILGACASPLPFLDVLPPIGEKEIYKFDSNGSGGDDDNHEKVDYKDILKKRFDFKYAHSQLEKIPSKLSISTLHPAVLDDEENPEHKKKYKPKALPEFAIEAKKATAGSDRGTATHAFLQFCNFKNLKENGFDNELKNLTENFFISKQYAEIIEKQKQHIEDFISSKMMDEFLNAKSIIREFRFNILLPAKEFSKEPDSGLTDEEVLVQGVVDCLYENSKGELILVDYKTDNVPKETYIDDLIRKHKIQLKYYEKALNEMLKPYNRKISKVYIYSVPYSDMIELE